MWVVLAREFLDNAMVFFVSAARVFAVVDNGFAVRFSIPTTPVAAMGLRHTRNPDRLMMIPFVPGNAIVFLVPAARVLAVTDVGFAICLITRTTPTATVGVLLTRNTALLLMIFAATLVFTFADSRRGTAGIVAGVAFVGHGHPVGGGGGGRSEREGRPRDPNTLQSREPYMYTVILDTAEIM